MNFVPGFARDGGLLDTSRLCVCTARIQEAEDVVTLVFERVDGRAFKFLAGQFVTISFSWNGADFSRVFTVASPPTRPERIALTIKAARDGKATRILHDHFGEGATAEISEARGEFTLEGRTLKKVLFLCAGSGITPFMSMLRALDDAGSDLDISFIQCARTESAVLFGEELRKMVRLPNLRVETVCSRAKGPHIANGRMNLAKLISLVPDVTERTAFVCGPAAFMQAMRSNLLEVGVAAGEIFEEDFGTSPPGATERPALDTSVSDGKTISFLRSGIHCSAGAAATILELAEAAGIHIETSCRMGVCGSCKVNLTIGTVDMNDLGGLSDGERAAGLILACCSVPTSDITIDL
ncbi:MAG: iron-sulfur cluster-binding domain-containing protein [Mesorhizobium sp.]|nr:MAG: iron-sulfur cluster-binding domain-containing protein [Mesorhizobium sp.]